MQQLIDSYTKSQELHHAYIVEGNCEVCVADLETFFTDTVQLKTRGNANYIVEARDTFLIGNARRLRELQLNKKQPGEKKVFIMSFHFITREAQNALLKVLEEPTEGTHIFLVTPRKQIFLPTVLSRVALVNGHVSEAGDIPQVSKDTMAFLEASYKDRMKYIVSLMKKIKDEKKSKSDALQLLEEIIFALHTNMRDPAQTKAVHAKISKLQQTHSYMQDQGAAVKMLLEEAALIV